MTEPRPPAPGRSQHQWLLSVLPAFPLILLVLRLWYLSRQDLPTMLLLVQYVSPLGMVSALMITLIWAAPAAVLVLRLLGMLLLVSVRDQADARRSLLAVTVLRMPDWVVVLAALLAALTWQLRFLPVLVMLVVAILALTAEHRHPGHRRTLRIVTVGVPVAAALLTWLWTAPGVPAALAAGEPTTVVLLVLPPALGVLLTGPVPARAARLVTHWPAVAAALVAPFAVGAVFLRAPILPAAALETGPAAGGDRDVLRGHVIAVNDVTTTLLDRDGRVRFLVNSDVRSIVLCPEPAQVPAMVTEVRGWHVEVSVLEWVAPKRQLSQPDPRCLGRPLTPDR